MHEDRDGVFARKTFRFGDFVLEWKGSLTQSGHLKKRKYLLTEFVENLELCVATINFI